MSNKAQYSDYVVLRGTNEVFKLKFPSLWDTSIFPTVITRTKEEFVCNKSALIRIPNEFAAYIRNDSLFHGLTNCRVILTLKPKQTEEIFRDLSTTSSALFKSGNVWVSLEDIDLATITPWFLYEEIDDFIIPPMPSLEELQHCSVYFDGRKTIITYCDTFVGEAICHRDDEFKVESGIALAYGRAKQAKDEYDAKQEEKKIKVGDVVKVVDAGQNFSSYYEKVAEICQKINNMYACARYAYEERLFDSEDQHDEFKVLYIDEDYAYIENVDNWKCRLVTPQAICKAELFKETKIDDEIDWEDDDLW